MKKPTTGILSISICSDKIAVWQMQPVKCEYNFIATNYPSHYCACVLLDVYNGTLEQNINQLQSDYPTFTKQENDSYKWTFKDKSELVNGVKYNQKEFHFLYAKESQRAKFLLNLRNYKVALRDDYRGKVKEKVGFEVTRVNMNDVFFQNKDFLTTLIAGEWEQKDIKFVPIPKSGKNMPIIVIFQDEKVNEDIARWTKPDDLSELLQAVLTGLLGMFRSERIKFNAKPFPHKYIKDERKRIR